MNDFEMDMISETENFTVWASEDDGERMFHIELGAISLHLNSEEWEEFVVLMKGVE